MDAPVLIFKFAVVFAVCVPAGDVGLGASGVTTVVPPLAAKDTYWVLAVIYNPLESLYISLPLTRYLATTFSFVPWENTLVLALQSALE